MSIVREICVLVNYSPKWGNISGKMQENFQGKFDPDTTKFSTPEKLCPTRWTVERTL